MKQVFWVLVVLLGSGCNITGDLADAPVKVGDSLCIGGDFYKVESKSAYPWVHLIANVTCQMKTGTPDTIIDFSKLSSFQPNCVCRYSVACRKFCEDEMFAAKTKCLDSCTQ